VTLNGCGAESITLPTPYTAALWIENSNITINSMRMVFVSGSNLTQETYYTWFNNSKVTMTGCVFSPLASVSAGFNTYNMVVTGNSRIIANNCTLPSGGLLGTAVQQKQTTPHPTNSQLQDNTQENGDDCVLNLQVQ
jgi:hypothetical protein